MKEFEREEANIDELVKIGEYQLFANEEFQSKELVNNEFEEFKVKEIQPQSFVENKEKTIKKENNSDELRKRLNNHVKNTINTSTSTGSTYAMVEVSSAVVVGIVALPDYLNVFIL